MHEVLKDLHNCCSPHEHFVATCGVALHISLHVLSVVAAPCCNLFYHSCNGGLRSLVKHQ